MAEPEIAPTLAPAVMNANSALALLLVEQVRHEAPEHRDHEKVEDADPDEEHAGRRSVVLLAR